MTQTTVSRVSRFGARVRALLTATALMNGPAGAAAAAEDDRRRMANGHPG
jgi:hypothetical protein